MTAQEVDIDLVPPEPHSRTVPSDVEEGERPLCSAEKGVPPPKGKCHQLDYSSFVKRAKASWWRVLLWLAVAGYFSVALAHDASRALAPCLVALAIFLIQCWDAVSKLAGFDLDTLMSPLERRCARCPEGLGLVVTVFLMLLTMLAFCWSQGEWDRLIPASGLLALILIGWATSAHRTQIHWRPVVSGVALQFLLGLFIMKTDTGFRTFQTLGNLVADFLAFTDEGSKFVFGDQYKDFFMAFKVLPVIVFFSSLVSAAYYLGLIQEIFVRIGWLMQKIMGTGYCESLVAAANIFLGQTEAPLMIKPFLPHMTKSEIHSVMTSGYASIAGSVLGAYMAFGVPPDHLLAASVMSCPAALAVAKLMYPETEVTRTNTLKVITSASNVNVLDAMTTGVYTGMSLAASVAGMLIASVAIMAFLNSAMEFSGELVGIQGMTLDAVFSYLFWPLALLMGVPQGDCQRVGLLIGQKTFVNEFLAYTNLEAMKAKGEISSQAEIIATYALCGFSNFGSIGVQVGGFSTLEPSRRGDFAQLAFRAMVAGTIACLMTGCIAGMLVKSAA